MTLTLTHAHVAGLDAGGGARTVALGHHGGVGHPIRRHARVGGGNAVGAGQLQPAGVREDGGVALGVRHRVLDGGLADLALAFLAEPELDPLDLVGAGVDRHVDDLADRVHVVKRDRVAVNALILRPLGILARLVGFSDVVLIGPNVVLVEPPVGECRADRLIAGGEFVANGCGVVAGRGHRDLDRRAVRLGRGLAARGHLDVPVERRFVARIDAGGSGRPDESRTARERDEQRDAHGSCQFPVHTRPLVGNHQ